MSLVRSFIWSTCFVTVGFPFSKKLIKIWSEINTNSTTNNGTWSRTESRVVRERSVSSFIHSSTSAPSNERASIDRKSKVESVEYRMVKSWRPAVHFHRMLSIWALLEGKHVRLPFHVSQELRKSLYLPAANALGK